jgi:hypothetical protein
VVAHQACRDFDGRIGRRDVGIAGHQVGGGDAAPARGRLDRGHAVRGIDSKGIDVGRKGVQHVRMADDAEQLQPALKLTNYRQPADLLARHAGGDLREGRRRRDGLELAGHPHADEHRDS